MIASPADGTTTLNGLRFHFLDWGTAGLPPVLLLHGGAQTAHSWDEVAPDLARDHVVLALDQRGHGDTDRAPDGRYRRDDFVADIRTFLDDVAPTIVPAGGQAIRTQLAQRDFASFEEAVERAHAFNPRRSLENIRERLRHSLRQLPDGRWTYKFDSAIGCGGLE